MAPASTMENPVPLWPTGSEETVGLDDQAVPRLTPFLPSTGAPTAAVVVCPGGGYWLRADHEGAPVAAWLNSLGVTGFVLDYRVAPHRHPAPLRDAQRAVRLVRHHAGRWGIDPARVGVLGFSAGGHLAASLATHFDGGHPAADDPVERVGCRPDLVVLGYPVISFVAHGHAGSIANLLGPDPPEDLRRRLSAELSVTTETPATFIWHTADDAGVPVENSLGYAAALSRHRVPFALHVFPRGAHGLGLAAGDPVVGTWTALCAAWLATNGFGPVSDPT